MEESGEPRNLKDLFWPLGGTVFGLIVVPVAIAQYPQFFNENTWLLPLSVAVVIFCWGLPLLLHKRALQIYRRVVIIPTIGPIALVIIIAAVASAGGYGWVWLLHKHQVHLAALNGVNHPSPSSLPKDESHQSPKEPEPATKRLSEDVPPPKPLDTSEFHALRKSEFVMTDFMVDWTVHTSRVGDPVLRTPIPQQNISPEMSLAAVFCIPESNFKFHIFLITGSLSIIGRNPLVLSIVEDKDHPSGVCTVSTFLAGVDSDHKRYLTKVETQVREVSADSVTFRSSVFGDLLVEAGWKLPRYVLDDFGRPFPDYGNSSWALNEAELDYAWFPSITMERIHQIGNTAPQEVDVAVLPNPPKEDYMKSEWKLPNTWGNQIRPCAHIQYRYFRKEATKRNNGKDLWEMGAGCNSWFLQQQKNK